MKYVRKPGRPRNDEWQCAYVDGHDSHKGTVAIKHCIVQKIVTIFLPSQNSHNDQVPDCGPNAKVDTVFSQEMSRLRRYIPGVVLWRMVRLVPAQHRRRGLHQRHNGAAVHHHELRRCAAEAHPAGAWRRRGAHGGRGGGASSTRATDGGAVLPGVPGAASSGDPGAGGSGGESPAERIAAKLEALQKQQALELEALQLRHTVQRAAVAGGLEVADADQSMLLYQMNNPGADDGGACAGSAAYRRASHAAARGAGRGVQAHQPEAGVAPDVPGQRQRASMGAASVLAVQTRC